MIKDLPSTNAAAVNKALVDLRQSGGAIALGRVLTLVVVTGNGDVEEAISAANDASREHPCRVIVIARGARRGSARLDAQIRVGGDAGASEVIVLRTFGALSDHGASVVMPLLLSDAPVVAWWPAEAPERPAEDPVGALAQRRVTDATAARRPGASLEQRRRSYRPGDTDLAWTRLTLWRGLLAAALDQPPYERVQSVEVVGGPDSPSADLLAAWLAETLRCPVQRKRSRNGQGISAVRLERRSGAVELLRPKGPMATLSQPGQPDRRIALARREVRECLAEELRRLDPDEIYGEVVTKGLPRLTKSAGKAKKRAAGTTPSAS